MHLSKAAVYFENGIGNFILFTPALQAISHWWCHGSPVDLIIRKDFRDARIGGILDIAKKLCGADNSPLIGNIIEYPSEEFKPQMYKFTFKSCHGGAPYEVPGFSTSQNPKTKWTLSCFHEIEYYMYELYCRGYRGNIPKPIFPVAANPIEVDKSKVNIALCNGTFKVKAWLKKQWPEKYWRELITQLERRGFVCWWLGGDTDAELGSLLVPSERMLAGKLSITESGGFISDCDITVSTDTALAHIAATLGLDQVVVWGGTLLSKNRPWNRNGITRIARVQGLSCSPCMGSERFDRCQTYRCMDLLESQIVERHIQDILQMRGKG